MKLRKPCEHNRYDPHVTGYASPTCPGGEFLPEDALADIAWQFNEAVSLLRECRKSVAAFELSRQVDDELPAIQAALVISSALADVVGPG